MRIPGTFRVVESPYGAVRLDAAASFLRTLPAHHRITIIGATRGAADDLARRAAVDRPATFGMARLSLVQLAARTALVTLAA